MDIEPWVTILGFVASIASLVLAVIAIWLSIRFFQLSNAQAERAAQAAAELSGSVTRLESLFDRMYSDTFGMVQNMQERVWQMVEVPEKGRMHAASTSSGSAVVEEPSDEVSPLDSDQHLIDDDDQAEIRILSILREARKSGTGKVTAGELVARSMSNPESDAIRALFGLRLEGKVAWRGSAGSLETGTLVWLTEKGW